MTPRSSAPSIPDVGQRLAAARMQRGLTQGELARAAGLAPSYLSRLENGKVQPTFKKVMHIVDVLGADVTELVGPSPRGGRYRGPCPVTTGGRCLVDLISIEPGADPERYSPREVRLIRRFARWLKHRPPNRARAMEILLDDLLGDAEGEG